MDAYFWPGVRHWVKSEVFLIQNKMDWRMIREWPEGGHFAQIVILGPYKSWGISGRNGMQTGVLEHNSTKRHSMPTPDMFFQHICYLSSSTCCSPQHELSFFFAKAIHYYKDRVKSLVLWEIGNKIMLMDCHRLSGTGRGIVDPACLLLLFFTCAHVGHCDI